MDEVSIVRGKAISERARPERYINPWLVIARISFSRGRCAESPRCLPENHIRRDAKIYIYICWRGAVGSRSIGRQSIELQLQLVRPPCTASLQQREAITASPVTLQRSASRLLTLQPVSSRKNREQRSGLFVPFWEHLIAKRERGSAYVSCSLEEKRCPFGPEGGKFV